MAGYRCESLNAIVNRLKPPRGKARMAKLYDLIIVGWAELQERPDRANYTWFKFPASTITSHLWAHASLEQKAVWITLLCLRNAQQEDVIHTRDFVLAGYCGIAVEGVPAAISGLLDFGVIRDVSRHLPGKILADSGKVPGLDLELEKEEKKRAGVPEMSPKPQCPAFDFELIYSRYPRKEKKTSGLAKCKAQIKTPEDYRRLSHAVDNYAKNKTGVELKYIMQFSTFMGEWRDWLDSETGTKAETPRPRTAPLPDADVLNPHNPDSPELAQKFGPAILRGLRAVSETHGEGA